MVGSINIGCMCWASPFTVMISNWRGTRIAGLVGGTLCVAGLAMSSFVGHLYLLILTYGVVFGIGLSFCYTTTYSVLSLWFDKQLSLVNGLSSASGFISTIVFSPILQHMLVAWGLHSTLLIMAVVFSTTSIAALLYKPPTRSQNYQPIQKQATRLFDVSFFKNKPFLVLIVGLMTYCMGGFTAVIFVPLFARESGVPEEQVPYLLIAWACFSILSSFVLGRIADMYRAHRLFIFQITLFGVASVTAFFAVVTDFVWFVCLMAVYGIFKSGFILFRPVLVQDIVGAHKTPSALGMMFGFLGISNMASYPFTGWIFDMTQSYGLAFAVAAGFAAAGSSLLFLIPVLQSREHQAQKCVTTCLQIKEDSCSGKEEITVAYTVLAVRVNELFEPPKKQAAVMHAVTYACAQETQV